MNRETAASGLSAVAFALAAWLPGATHGEIITDGTMGAAVDLAGPDYAITEDLGARAGDNLFHSFDRFNVGQGQSATFYGTPGIQNVIGRVTGGMASSIDGTVNSAIPGASLYLVNPSGIMFGEHASINVDGSFHASTADYVTLGNGGRFDAGNPGNTLLTQAPPTAFGFLGAPAGISIDRSTLAVPQGRALTLSGGDLDIQDGILHAPGGRISIASLASPGEAVITAEGFDTGSFSQLGNVTISHQGNFYTRNLANLDTSGDSGGIITIRAGRFVMDNGYIFADNINGTGGLIDIGATESVTLRNESHATTDSYGSGDGGEINISAVDLLLENGGIVQVDNYSTGIGGTINIHATGTILVQGVSPAGLPYIGGFESGLNANTFGPGNGGAINITAARVVIGDSAKIDINSFSTGIAGRLDTDTAYLQVHNGGSILTDAFGSGHAGTILINVDQASLESGGTIAATTRGTGNGGTITIAATGNLDITGSDGTGPSGIFTNSFSSGNGGTIRITADRLSVSDGSGIQSAVTGVAATPATSAGDIVLHVTDLLISGQGQISTQSENTGQAGNILVDAAGRINISSPDDTIQSGLFSTATGSGNGGNIALDGSALAMDGGAINASSAGAGNAGTITLQLDRMHIQGGGQLSTSVSGQGAGGDLVAVISEDATISGQSGSGFGSGIYSATQGDGTGGNISLSARNVILDTGGVISAESTSTGDAGNITLAAAASVTLDRGSIQTRAVIADGGNIDLQALRLVYLDDGEITSSVGTGFGNGGNITIDPEFVVLDRGRIFANAYGGTGGNILIRADNYIASTDSLVDASSQLGIDGTVTIESPNSDPGSGLVELPESFLNASALLREPCAARRSVNQSSFIVHGQSAIPPGPESMQPLPGPAIATDAASSQPPATAISIAAGQTVIAGLEESPAMAGQPTECRR